MMVSTWVLLVLFPINIFQFISVFSGTTEAFLHAVVTKSQLARSNVWLIVCSAIYISLSITLIHMAGAVGLTLANCFSILLSVFAGAFIY
jgi:hypothetical protein